MRNASIQHHLMLCFERRNATESTIFITFHIVEEVHIVSSYLSSLAVYSVSFTMTKCFIVMANKKKE